jgi:hypothetical protein
MPLSLADKSAIWWYSMPVHLLVPGGIIVRFSVLQWFERTRRPADANPLVVYRFLAMLTFDLAGEFGLHLSEATRHRWESLMELAYYLDQLIDGAQTLSERDKVARYQAFFELIGGREPLSYDGHVVPLDLKLALHNFRLMLGEIPFEALYLPSLQIAAKADRKTRCRRVWAYGACLIGEGWSTADLFFACMTPIEQEQVEYRRFKAWITQFMSLALLGDHLMDLAEDGTQGLTGVVPNGRNYSTMSFITAVWLARLGCMNSEATKRMLALARPFVRQVREGH